MLAALGCGLHLHRPRDAATAEGAEGDLRAARLVDGFVEELAQSRAMAVEELAAAQAWAEVGRDRDLLDILAARDESDPEIEPLYFTRCRARYKGDGWTTLCSKISTRLHALTGHAFPSTAAPAPVAARAKPPAAAPAPAPDPAADLLRDLRGLQRHWKGPDSGESRLARAVNEHQVAARALRLGPTDDPPGCPGFDAPGRAPALQASFDRQRALCLTRRENLQALSERIVCRGPDCGPSELGAVVEQTIAVHDALQLHHDELARRLRAYDAARRPCAGAMAPLGQLVQAAGASPPASDAVSKDISSETGPSEHALSALALGTDSSEHALSTFALGTGSFEHAPSALTLDAGSLEHASSPLAFQPGSFNPVPETMSSGVAPAQPTAPGLFDPAPVGAFLGAGLLVPPRPLLTAPATDPAPAAAPPPVAAPATCDEAVLQARFTALAEVPVPPALVAHDLRPLGEIGRRYQLAEQLAAVDALIDAIQRRAQKRQSADARAVSEALAAAPRLARAVHATIVGVDRLQETVDTLGLAVLALIRETLRVEHHALGEAIELAERRLRLQRAKLAAQLDEAVLLLEAHLSLSRLERAGCTGRALMPAYEAGSCRDELTRALTAFGNAWTLGRAGQKRADAIDLAVRHDASILRSRAAMALRQVYLAAGVTELVQFTRGGMAPEALAQLIVSTVGFGVLAGAVLAK